MPASATSTSLGASPRVHPRPAYPPVTEVALSFVKEVIWQGGVTGAFLTSFAFPGYQWTRAVAKEWEVSDQLYFAIMTSLVHTVIYLVCNFGERKLSRRSEV
jgi:hypothetical protein